MYRRTLGLLLLGCGLAIPGLAAAQAFSSGSTGADGAFNPTCSPTPCTVTVPLPPTGVFNFTSVAVPSGVTVKFTPNAANTPVILLATGAVTIAGTLDVSGGPGTAWGRPGAGGPGGFAGGVGADGVTTTRGSAGLGPGGGAGGDGANGTGGGGSYATAGSGAGGPLYGSTALRPILGGSGGGGGGTILGNGTGGGGGGGGGAILIASSASITASNPGSIRATGGTYGTGCAGCGFGGYGSGGAIRLIAPTVSGDAQLWAKRPGSGSFSDGDGRIRLEATTLSYTGGTFPLATTALPQPVFPPAGQPSLTIASVAGIAAPASPTGSFLATPDIVLPAGTTNPLAIVLSASRIPLGTAILVTAKPQSGTTTSATSTGLSGGLDSSTATASLSITLTQTNALTAVATYPLVASAGEGPLYADGEEVTHVKVAAVFGGPSTTTYLTRSGREVRLQ